MAPAQKKVVPLWKASRANKLTKALTLPSNPRPPMVAHIHLSAWMM
jgi:hypothetical protein